MFNEDILYILLKHVLVSECSTIVNINGQI